MASSFSADKCANFLTYFLHMFGLWRLQPLNLFYLLYSMLYLFICSGLSTFFMIFYLFNLPDQRDLTYGLYMSLTQLCGFIKFMFIFVRNRSFQALVDRIKSFTVKNDDEKRLIDQRIGFIYKATVFYCCVGVGSIHCVELMAFLADNVMLPFSAWYPFLDWKHRRRDYWLAVAYQHISINSCCILICCIDVLFSLLLFVVSIRLEIIGMRMQQTGYAKWPNDKEKDAKNSRFEAENMQVLIDCVVQHNEAIAFKETIAESFNVPFFFQVIQSAIIISSIVSEIVRVSAQSRLKRLNPLLCFLTSDLILLSAKIKIFAPGSKNRIEIHENSKSG